MDPVAVAGAERRRDIWLAVAVCCTAVALAALVMTATATAYNGAGVRWVLLVVVVAGVMGFPSYWKPYLNAKKKADRLRNPEESGEGDMLPEQMMGDPRIVQMANGNEQIARLLWVVADISDQIMPVMDSFKTDDEGNLTDYAFKATKVGLFGSKSIQNHIYDALRASIPGSGWDIRFHPETDDLVATCGDDLPSLALPEIWPVVSSAGEAKTRYNKWELSMGPGASGMITVNPQVFPHLVVVATTGGGKSVFLRSCAEQFRAIGAQLIFGDGKGSDYAAYNGKANVIATGRGSGSRGMEYAAAIELAFRIMQSRQDTAAERKMTDPDHWKEVPPVFVILDEMKAVMKKWKSDLKGDEFKKIESRMNQILALGRELRVHVCFAVQDVYAESIPRPWLTNVGMKVSLGKPNSKTIEQGFEGEIQGAARRVADKINPKIRGRGMIAGFDEDSGTSQVLEYQGYLSYAPGESIAGAPTPEAQQNMSQFKEQVSDAIPSLYSRKWFKIDEKPEAQVKAEAKTGDIGYIDFEQFTPSELANLQVVNLDMRDESGNIVPDPEMVIYDPDPQNLDYVCHPVRSEANTVVDI